MANFKRAKTKVLPSDWRGDIESYKEARSLYLASEEYKQLDDPRKPIVTSDGYVIILQSLCPTKTEVYEFFETVLATDEISQATLRLCIAGEKMANGEPYNEGHFDTVLSNDFGEWWLNEHCEYPMYAHSDISGLLWLIVTDALFQALNGCDLRESYFLLDDEIKLAHDMVVRKNLKAAKFY